MKIEDMVTFEVNGRKCVALVRKLTERECFRLMGVDDDRIDVIANSGVSRTAQYKMAGNSIVVDVLYHIFHTAFIPLERGDASDMFGGLDLINGEFDIDYVPCEHRQYSRRRGPDQTGDFYTRMRERCWRMYEEVFGESFFY